MLKLKIKNCLTKIAINDILEFCNLTRQILDDRQLPKSFYMLEKISNLGRLEYKIGFKCLNCDFECLINENEKECSNCTVEYKFRTIFSKNNFFIFNLKQQLFYILNSFELTDYLQSNDESVENISDGEVYKEYVSMKINEKIITLQFFSDGFKVFQGQESLIQAWPIFFKVNELKTREDNKVFLYGCFIGDEKPDVDFYLNSLTKELNDLCEYGLYLPKLNRTVYPLALNCILDIPAKAHFLCHAAHNAKYGCSTCTIKSDKSSAKINKRIFKPIRRRLYKSKNVYRSRLPYKGKIFLCNYSSFSSNLFSNRCIEKIKV